MSITKISPSVVDFDAGITISTTDNTSNLILTSTDADANTGPVLELYRNSSSPADNDELARIYFYGENDNDEKIEYGLIRATIIDASDGTEDSLMQFLTYTGGGQKSRIELLATETVFNEGSSDIDFRVEGDGNTHALFVQASDDKVGIGVSDPGGLPLHLKVASGDNKLRQETASKDAFTLGLDNSTGDTIIGTNALYPAVRFLNAGGIAFGSDTAAANALDDYEEGSYNPSLAGDQSGSFGTSASGDTLFYTKIGRLVTVQGYITITSDSSANGTLKIGLPVTAATLTDDGDYAFGTVFIQNNGSTLGHNLYVFVQPGGFFYIYKVGDDGTGSYIDHGDVDADWQFGVGFSYIAA
jgi:hypothetical protein